ncbi:2'-5' RNA ligase family protein [Paenibacillus polygoni]|uniref:2'-5' RNA ligase family protein n=1 Tax=Paenibacillus polygoni TaxID=3050112 RepID=A0ABY8XCR8_9BACL|nr:2'-5' RNA ligase family protein [Paenibacillus polygoni]WIV21220.1 2'-5' RNA ligase family protein [Paenibacillus polygoni]
MYGVVAHFDQDTELYIKQVWKELSDHAISKYAEEVQDRRPHITIAGYDSDIDIDQFISDFDCFYESKKQLSITMNSIGTFLNTGILFFSPVPSIELLTFHANHHRFFENYRLNAESPYLPNNWVPHCTIANRLNDEKLKEAMIYCTKRIKNITAMIVEVSVTSAIYENNKCIKSPSIHTKTLDII